MPGDTVDEIGDLDDAGRVAALRAGDPRGLASAYEAYADRLFSFCATMLGDRAAAEDVVHDSFVVAGQRAHQLRDPSRLRPWLYAIARSECLRHLRARRRTGPLDEAGEWPDQTVNLDAGLHTEELRTLVWAALDGLNPGEKAALELTLRHDLPAADIASVLNVSPANAAKLLARARAQLERGVAAILVARTGQADCTDLAEVVGGWDGRLTVLMRKRIGRHLERCRVCGQRRRREVNAGTLLAGAPLLVAPAALRDRVLTDVGDVRLVAAHRELARRAGPFDRDGFPRSGRGPGRAAAVAVGAALLIVVAVGGLSAMPSWPGTEQPVPGAGAAPEPTLIPAPPTGRGGADPPPAGMSGQVVTGVSPPGPITSPAATRNPETSVGPVPPGPSGRPGSDGSSAPGQPPDQGPSTAEPASLVITPGRLVLGSAERGALTVSATGGPVSWEATASTTGLTVRPPSGTATPDRRTTIEVSLDRTRRRDSGHGVVTLRWGAETVPITVTWD